jgi:hypothetical protein
MRSGLLTEPLQLANTSRNRHRLCAFFVILLTLTIFASLKQLNPAIAKLLPISALDPFEPSSILFCR